MVLGTVPIYLATLKVVWALDFDLSLVRALHYCTLLEDSHYLPYLTYLPERDSEIPTSTLKYK